MDSELKSLVIERGSIKAALTRLQRFFRENACNTTIGSLRKRLAANIALYDKFNNVQTQIEIVVADSEAAASHALERETFENAYFDLVDAIETHIANSEGPPRQVATASPAVYSAVSGAAINVRLPTIQLPSFDGNYSNWLRFRDSFMSLVHQNETLSDVQRFHYLNSSLKGAAARVIQSLGVSEDNYKLAWELLNSRYENSTALKRHHVTALLDLKIIQKQSEIALREFLDDATNHRIALKALGESVESWDALIILLLSRKLDSVSIREWERRITPFTEMATFAQFATFLEERAKYLANVAATPQVPAPKVDQRPINTGNRRFTSVTAHVVNSFVCPICKTSHALFQCERFKKLEPSQKTKVVQEAHLCFNCLAPGHRVSNCTRTGCKQCNRKHHSLLHRPDIHPIKPTITNCNLAEDSESTVEQPCVANVSSHKGDHMVLATAIVYVRDSHGHNHPCRALLDSGSQAHFITTEFCRRVGLRPSPTDITVCGIGKINSSLRGRVTVTIHSRNSNFQSTINCLSMDEITANMPSTSLARERADIPRHVQPADPEFDISKPIDLLIGAGLFWPLLTEGEHRSRSGLVWHNTHLGWVLGGMSTWAGRSEPIPRRCHLATTSDLHAQLERFWALEEVNSGVNKPEDECESHFRANTRQDRGGRYIVRIPFKSNIVNLGTSRDQAERRLRSLERRLARQPNLKAQYIEFMEEYEALGHMSEIVKVSEHKEPTYYLPHHAVCKESSTTTQLRVVFDGSAKSSSGLSLNDTQSVGPIVQSDLVSILLRFRSFKYVLSADISKMYRQILVNPKDRRFQRILWRADPTFPIREFELNTVTYGTASAPFLATRVLREIGLKCADSYPSVSKVIINDFYVDDLLTGAQSAVEIENLKAGLMEVFSKAGMQLRKWATNCPYRLRNSDGTGNDKQITVDKDPKTLGLWWSPTTDELTFTIRPSSNKRVTKRIILSDIAQIFDPLGLIGPIIITAKLILQRLWQIQVGWDESVPQELANQWLEYRRENDQIDALKIPRCAIPTEIDDNTQLELHGFSDASERAYGACVYLRSRSKSGQWVVTLLCAKSRVAPLKTVSLPRLELCGALILAHLINKVKLALNLVNCTIYLWTDSTITLAWLRSSPIRWKTFVANRVSEIQTLTDSDSWKHVRSEDNPADLISRGVKPSELPHARIWWSGPTWLGERSDLWPVTLNEFVNPPEERHVINAMITSSAKECDIFKRFSNYTRLLRVTAYCFRFIQRSQVKSKGKRVVATMSDIEPLRTGELEYARARLECLAQEETFSNEKAALESGQPVPKSSPLKTLNAFLDNQGVIRVGGRLANAPINHDMKYPVILPAKHPFTELVIRHEHLRLLHAGTQAVIASLRTRYWPLACRNNVKRVILNCIRCFRANPRSETHQMGQLPATRVTPARPFYTCGVDYAGPFHTRERTRSKITIKAYLCLFVCFVTKAVHIELATDLSTNAFLNCLRRFIARRGRCHCIVSDNGTNFIGARRELDELGALIRNKNHNKIVTDTLNEDGIEWRLLPPHSPHFGGLWERAVRSAKHHLKRVIGDQRLTFEELYTVLTQVESCLNSQPLSPMSSDPTDLSPLTPGHFLIGTCPTTMPDRNLEDVPTNRLNRFQLLQKMFQHFWRRWQAECIHEMQQRYKWQHKTTNQIALDALVIIKEDNSPPLHWSLGRVVQLHPGQDGVARVATVRTSTGNFKRPVTKLCILPMASTAEAIHGS